MMPKPDPQVVSKAISSRRSVVQIYVVKKVDGKESYCGSGTGFIIKTKGANCLVMTNRHVLEGNRECFDAAQDQIFVRVMCKDGGIEELQGSLRFLSGFVDLAMIEVKGMTKEMPLALSFTPSSKEPIGITAVAIGYCNPICISLDAIALAKIPSVCRGSIAGPLWTNEDDEEGGEETWLYLDCSIMKGCSGGPVLCKNGVTGVIACSSSQVTLAITTESVHETLKMWLRIPDRDERTTQEIINGMLL